MALPPPSAVTVRLLALRIGPRTGKPASYPTTHVSDFGGDVEYIDWTDWDNSRQWTDWWDKDGYPPPRKITSDK